MHTVEFWWIVYGMLTDPEPASVYFFNGKPNEAFVIGREGPMTNEQFKLCKKLDKYRA